MVAVWEILLIVMELRNVWAGFSASLIGYCTLVVGDHLITRESVPSKSSDGPAGSLLETTNLRL